MSSDLVSIVIPSFNHEAYVMQAIDSVLQQTHVAVELIIVDDGSTDRSRRYFRQLKDMRVRLFENENSGAHAAINFGLAKANGDWLGILNSDDVFYTHRVELLLQRLLSERCEFGATWIELIDGSSRSIGIKRGWDSHLPAWVGQRTPSADFVENLHVSNFISTTSNMLFSRKVYERIGGMRNLRFAHDWDFALRVAKHFRCLLLPEPLLQYRIHSANTIRSDKSAMMFEICWIKACYGYRQAGNEDPQSKEPIAISCIAGHIEKRSQRGDAEPEMKVLMDGDVQSEVRAILSF